MKKLYEALSPIREWLIIAAILALLAAAVAQGWYKLGLIDGAQKSGEIVDKQAPSEQIGS